MSDWCCITAEVQEEMLNEAIEENSALRAQLEQAQQRVRELEELLEERNKYKRAFENLCRAFNYGEETDYIKMRDAFLDEAKEDVYETR